MTKIVLLIGNDTYFRRVIGHELHAEGLLTHAIGEASAVVAIESDNFDVAVIAYPSTAYDTGELINILRLLRPKLPIVLYAEDRDFMKLIDRFPELPILDAHLSARDVAEELLLIANGQDPTPRKAPASRLEALLEKRARAESSQALATGLKRQYDETMKDPMPDALKLKLQKLFQSA